MNKGKGIILKISILLITCITFVSGVYLSSNVTMAASGSVCKHSYTWEVTKKPTCTTEGEEVYKCGKCSKVINVKAIAASHSFSLATCTSPRTCSVCGSKVGSAIGHSYEYTAIDETYHEAKCVNCGYVSKNSHELFNKKCTLCNYTKPEFGNEDKNCIHEYDWVASIESSCTRSGQSVYMCKKCNFILMTKKVEARGHKFVKNGGYLSNPTKHWEEWVCSCGAVEKRNEAAHKYNSKKVCKCGYVLKCSHNGLTVMENVYQNEKVHTIVTKCAICGEAINKVNEEHSSYVVNLKELDGGKHLMTLECNKCNKKFAIKESHSINDSGVCDCGYALNAGNKLTKIEFIYLESIFAKQYTVRIGEIVNLKDKIRLTPENAKVNLKFSIVDGENDVISIETFTGKINAKKIPSKELKIRVEDTITKLYDEVNLKVIENSEYKMEDTTVNTKFNDIKDGAWYKADIDKAVKDGLFNGTDEYVFSPDLPITRGMFVTVLARLERADIKDFANSFDDVWESAYYQESISWAAANGIVKGVGNNKFDPDAQITREAMAVIIYNYIKSFHRGLIEETVNTVNFADNYSISDWAKSEVYELKKLGLVNGKSANNYMPKDIVTRAEGAVILERVAERIRTQKITNSNNKCTTDSILPDHRSKLVVGYTDITKDNHSLKYDCTICKVSWPGTSEDHAYTSGKCVCGYACKHDGNKKVETKINSENKQVEVTKCEICGLVIKEVVAGGSGAGTGTTPPKQEETTPPKQEETTPPKQDETTPPKQEETTPPKQEETTPPKQEETTPPKQEETTPPKQEETTPPKQEETTPPKQDESYLDYSPFDFGQDKPVIEKGTYTEADYARMEAELEAKVKEAGYGTRAGAVQAALYLARLDYAVPYRGTPMQPEIYIGTYNKKGLNRTWGTYVKTTRSMTVYGKVYNAGYSAINGMDCGAFVTWALINGGVLKEGEAVGPSTDRFTKDSGSLPNAMRSSLGGAQLRAHALKDVANEVEPGDIALTYAERLGKKTWTHIGLIVGVDEGNIYVAESNTTTYNPETGRSKTVNKVVLTRVPKSHVGDVLGWIVLCDDKLYTAKNADGTENKGNIPMIWGN